MVVISWQYYYDLRIVCVESFLWCLIWYLLMVRILVVACFICVNVGFGFSVVVSICIC